MEQESEGKATSLIRWGDDAYLEELVESTAKFLGTTKNAYMVDAVKEKLSRNVGLVKAAMARMGNNIERLQVSVKQMEKEQHVMNALLEYSQKEGMSIQDVLGALKNKIGDSQP